MSQASNPEKQRFLDISVALSAERDREKLLSMLLDAAIDITNCDAGTLYLIEEDGLHFCRIVTRSQNVRQGGHDDPIKLPPVPLNPTYVSAWVFLNNKSVNVRDIRNDMNFDYSGSKRYDEITGYKTESMIAVPLANDRGELIGVMQLINALDEDGKTIPFSEDAEHFARAIASQAAISIANMKYSEQIISLLDSLVGALSTAIDCRTPYNANHTRNMVRYANAFLDWLEDTGNAWAFDVDKRRAFVMSVWLHDVGKLVTPLEVMDKDTRLGTELASVEHRFERMALLDKIALLEGKSTEAEYEAAIKKEREALELIRQINMAGFLPDAELAKIKEIAARTYKDENGVKKPWLTEAECDKLSIRKGTLTAKERAIMQEHVSMTASILKDVAFPKTYEKVPVWAGGHHELLNGSGYPKRLAGDVIPLEVRLLTILDIFDALTALDRPYKPGMPIEKAFSILDNMAAEGVIDVALVSLFKESHAWEAKEA